MPKIKQPMTDAQVDAFVDRHLKKFYAEVGKLAAIWAMVEYRMDQLIWHLSGVDQTLGACVTTQLNGTAPRLRAIKAMAELRGYSPDIITKLNKFGAEIISPQEYRNRAIHDPWFVGENTKEVHQIRKATINNKIMYGKVVISLKELQNAHDSARILLFKFNEIRDAILAEPTEALLERQRTPLWEAKLDGRATQKSPNQNP